MQDDALPAADSWLTFRSVLTFMVCCLSFAFFCAFLFTFAARQSLVAELINSFKVQLTIVMMVCASVMLLLRQRFFGRLLLIVSICQLFWIGRVFLPASQPAAGSDRIKVMSMNVWCDNRNFDKVIEHVEEEAPDVLLILEYSNQWHEGLKPLHSLYPYRQLQPRWHGYGIAMFSKRPLDHAQVWQLTRDHTDVPALTTNVSIGDHTVRLAGLHTMSPTSSLRINLRNDQMMEIADILTDGDQPTILMGDFNCTPWSPFFKDLIKRCGYRDSRQGQGHLASWNLDMPSFFWIPIDHALVSREIHVHRRSVGRACGSDHRSMIFEVSIAQ